MGADSETGSACHIGPEVFLAGNWRSASSAKTDNKAELRNMPNCQGNSVQRLIFPKWFMLKKKNKKHFAVPGWTRCALSDDFYVEAMERGGGDGDWGGAWDDLSELGCIGTRVSTHAHGLMAIRAHSLPTVELGNVHKSPKYPDTHTNSLYYKNTKHFTVTQGDTIKQTQRFPIRKRLRDKCRFGTEWKKTNVFKPTNFEETHKRALILLH